MPNSLLWIGLVVLSLFVLVPALVSVREPVHRPSERAFATRLLHRGGARRSARPHAGQDHSGGQDADAAAQDTPARTKNTHLYLIHGEDRMDTHDDYDEDARDTGQSAGYDPEVIARRRGRGGFDPEADRLAAQARYTFRQRAVLGLGALLVLSAVGAFIVGGFAWAAPIALGVALAGYLGYLRTQVRIEREIRDRRLARLRGERATREEAAADDRGYGQQDAVDYDDESPEFDDIDDYYDDRDGRLPRAAGQ